MLSKHRTARRLYSRVRGRPKDRMRLGEAGQALVEIAIALPILLALLVGIFEFARAYNVQQVITNAAREGAREAVLPGNGELEALARANARLSNAGITPTSVQWDCVPLACTTGAAVEVEIVVDYTFVFIGPVLSLFASGDTDPGTVPLRSSAIMRKE